MSKKCIVKSITNIYTNNTNTRCTLDVEWDEEKSRINLNKHKISFDMAAKVFFDQDRIEIFDELHSCEEERYITIGLVEDLLFVVYVQRKNALRIISARLATRKEREIYYGN